MPEFKDNERTKAADTKLMLTIAANSFSPPNVSAKFGVVKKRNANAACASRTLPSNGMSVLGRTKHIGGKHAPFLVNSFCLAKGIRIAVKIRFLSIFSAFVLVQSDERKE
jgi:hypothetical protein